MRDPKFQRPWLLAAITLIGALFRLYYIDEYWISADEGWWWAVCQYDLREFLGTFYEIPQPPLYFFFLWIISSFNNEILTLRLVSTLFGIAAIPAMYILGTKLASRKAGLIAAFILSVTPTAIIHSGVIRQYACLLFLTILFAIGFLRCIRGQSFGITLYVVSALLGIFVHYSFLLILAAGFLCMALLFFRKRNNLLLRQLIYVHVIIVGICIFLAMTLHPSLLTATIYRTRWSNAFVNSWLKTYFLKDVYQISVAFVMLFVYFFSLWLSALILPLTLWVFIELIMHKRFFQLLFLFMPIVVFIGASIGDIYPFGGNRHLTVLLPYLILPVSMHIARCRLLPIALLFVATTTISVSAMSTKNQGAIRLTRQLRQSLSHGDWKPPLTLRGGEHRIPWKSAGALAQLLRDLSDSGKIIAFSPSAYYALRPLLDLQQHYGYYYGWEGRPAIVFKTVDPNHVQNVLRQVYLPLAKSSRLKPPVQGLVLLAYTWDLQSFDPIFPIDSDHTHRLRAPPGLSIRSVEHDYLIAKLRPGAAKNK